ncbi:MAG: hypothetical protein M3228_05570, partial [Actinomycetota bacterium]|nr:hypothetical protein [Actinomycetota bacterium]
DELDFDQHEDLCSAIGPSGTVPEAVISPRACAAYVGSWRALRRLSTTPRCLGGYGDSVGFEDTVCCAT